MSARDSRAGGVGLKRRHPEVSDGKHAAGNGDSSDDDVGPKAPPVAGVGQGKRQRVQHGEDAGGGRDSDSEGDVGPAIPTRAPPQAQPPSAPPPAPTAGAAEPAPGAASVDAHGSAAVTPAHAPTPAAAPAPPATLPHEELYLSRLPCGGLYERSYMHRERVTHTAFAHRGDYFITGR